MVVLEAKNIGIQFGGLKAVDNFSLKIENNEIVGLIGPNGAGKTTTFNMLTGVYKPSNGDIIVNQTTKSGTNINESILGLNTYQVVDRGLARTFQNIRLFGELSVIDNIKIAYQKNMSYGILSGVLKTKKCRTEEEKANEYALELLKIFEMDNLAYTTAKNLPYGKQRKLEIARALATKPKVLMLDEPAAGMNPQETSDLMDSIKLIREKFGVAILLIEHDMNLVMNICERLVVLNYGVVLAEGTPEEIKNNPEVIKAYLGT